MKFKGDNVERREREFTMRERDKSRWSTFTLMREGKRELLKRERGKRLVLSNITSYFLGW